MVSSKIKKLAYLGVRPARANAGLTSEALARHRAVAKQMPLLPENHCLIAKKHETLTKFWVNVEPR